MGLLPDTRVLEPLREAQEDINVRLDAILVELRHLHVLLEALVGASGHTSPNGKSARRA